MSQIEIVKDRRLGTAYTPQGNTNESRNGFLHNCYNSSLGKFFQNTIKSGIFSVIRRIHDKEIPRYDKNAYTFDDPRLKNLSTILKNSFAVHLTDNDFERKQEIANMVADIVEFMMKDDIYYRVSILKSIQDIAKDAIVNPNNYALTDFEYWFYEKFREMGKVGCGDPVMKSYPSFDEWKKDPSCVDRWNAIHRPQKVKKDVNV